MARALISTDGYVAAGGEAAWAFVARRDGAVVSRGGRLVDVPPHLAEWRAMREALAWAEEALEAGDVLELRTDSALVAKGLASRRPAMSGEAGEARASCRQALARLGARGIRAKVVRVPREENVEADERARQAGSEDPRGGTLF